MKMFVKKKNGFERKETSICEEQKKLPVKMKRSADRYRWNRWLWGKFPLMEYIGGWWDDNT